MARTWLITTLAALAAALCAPLSAQARTPCPAEQLAPTAANHAHVSDAIFSLSNQIRAHYGLPAFRRDTRLDVAAALHSFDMGTRGYFDHTSPDGLKPGDRAAAQGYTQGVGENIAYGYSNARSAVLGWMASAGHCRNILSGAADLGVGTAVVGRRPYYTQALGDYFAQDVNEARSGCPYSLDLDTLTGGGAPGGPAAPPASSPPVTPVTQAPATTLSLRALSLSPRRFRAGRCGTTISFRLSTDASVTFRVQRAGGARGRYRAMTSHFTHEGAAGTNRVRFTGRLGPRTLRAGRYRLQAVATNAAGETTRVVVRSFVIVRG